jgi:hypothetical protein
MPVYAMAKSAQFTTEAIIICAGGLNIGGLTKP